MTNTLKHIADIENDVRGLTSRIAEYKREVQRVTNTRSLYDDDEEFIAALFDAIDTVTDDLDRVTDDLVEIEDELDQLASDIVYTELSNKIQAA